MNRLAGVDEVGRGAAAAEVYAGAVILDPHQPIVGLADSKRLSARQRSRLESEIKTKALAWCVASASLEEIEQLNVLGATMLAMQRAVEGLNPAPTEVLVDGNRLPTLAVPAACVVRGDQSISAISAASILAKEARDRQMRAYHLLYPQYRFDLHKGYLTPLHLEALAAFGPCGIHRRHYAPIRQLLTQPPLLP